MSVSFGINPITWSNDDLQYVGANFSLQDCLSDAAAAGYDGVELGHKFPRNPAELKPLLAAHELSLVSGWYSGQLLKRSASEEIKAMQKHADLLRAMDCDVLIFAEVTGCVHSDKEIRLSRRPRMSVDVQRRFADKLSEVARFSAENGLKLCYHHHMGTVVQSHEDIKALMEATSDDVYLLLDTGHAAFANANPTELANVYADRIGHVHCKDVRAPLLRACQNRDSSFLDAVLDGVFTVPGDGSVDYGSIFTALRSANYGGWIVVEAEQDPSVAAPAKYARLGLENLHSFISAPKLP
ncbi:MAG TPA: myo-inosose-2 dehydratase [Woeseiaceae bacterium]|nr:myo-inosose-2 dehydratase [Woeseiaceae bacterium]